MTQTASDWVKHHFAACALDWTPQAARGTAHVLYAPVVLGEHDIAQCAALLSDEERQRADRQLTFDGRARFVQRRAFRRYCAALATGAGIDTDLSRIRFDETTTGQPAYNGARGVAFSFSSCQLGVMAGWSATHDIGVDIEDPTREVETVDMAKRFFAPSEAAVLAEQATPERETHFFQLWTLKEAALKSIGHGLAYGLEAFAFEVSPQLRVASAPEAFGGPSRFDPHLIESGGSSAALVLHDRLPSP